MKSEITENREFYIISRKIDNAERCKVIQLCEDCFKVKLKNKRRYEDGESVELFTMTELGHLYFESIVKDIENDVISVWYPITSKYLQRREYTRINTGETVILKDKGTEINAEISDISAGGLKITSKLPLELLKDYEIILNIENKKINAVFQPIRIEWNENNFVSSGKFKNITNYDKIILVQFCFRKQIENNSL